MQTSDYIFDTLVDTQKIYVSMTTNFIVRDYIDSKGLSPIYLHITGGAARERLNLDIHINAKHWDLNKQRLKPLNKNFKDINLILDNIDAKITGIKTVYRLSEIILTPATLKQELVNDMPRVNFCTFFAHALKEQKSTLRAGTYRRHNSVLNKLKKYNPDLFFSDLNEKWFLNYKTHLKKIGNKDNTINSNIKSIKKFLRVAIKSGIKLSFDIDDVKSGSTLGNRISLKPNELKTLKQFYDNNLISETHKIILGYFLFSCMTGLRISDVLQLNRDDLQDKHIQFVSKKTQKSQIIALNKSAIEIIDDCKDLFVKKFTPEYINRELKLIMAVIGIKKRVTFHVARHTFATSFLRLNGRVEKLQLLLGHSSIKQTMIYSHIVAEEANESIHLLDKLF